MSLAKRFLATYGHLVDLAVSPFHGGETWCLPCMAEVSAFWRCCSFLCVPAIRWIGLAPWDFELSFPGSVTSTFLRTDSISEQDRILPVISGVHSLR